MDRFKASKCGYTQQLDGLEILYEKYKDQGLVVLAFPCNNFGGQEPGSDETISRFCRKSYGVTFPIMKKSDVNGKNENRVFSFLKGAGKPIGWNFEKFLVDQNGKVVIRYGSSNTAGGISADIQNLLQK